MRTAVIISCRWSDILVAKMLVVSNYWESIEMIISNLVFSYQTNSKLSWICLEHFCIMSLLQSQIYFKWHEYILFCKGVRVMVFIATFNNISVVSWRSVLLVDETRVPGENHRPAASHWQTLSHNVVSSTPCLSGIRTHNVSDDKHWLLI